MRTRSIIFPTLAVCLLAVACDNGGDDPEIPRTVPPTLKGSLTTVDVPPITAPAEKPANPPVVMGYGPIYET
jgi:hypothetical protein